MHSWRAVIIPFVEKGGHTFLEDYEFSVAWNDPRNEQANNQWMPYYNCPHMPNPSQSKTDCFLLTGPRTLYESANGKSFEEIADRKSETILFVEVHGLDVNWAAPKDLTVEEFLNIVRDRVPECRHDVGINVVACDAKVHCLRGAELDEVNLRALITTNGGEHAEIPH